MSTPTAIALGSNLGDRRAHLAYAVDQLRRHLANLRLSSIIETEPFDVPQPQPRYLNAVVVGETALEAGPLLSLLMEIEQQRGRQRSSLRAPRTLDLDLVLFGALTIETPALTVPHPRFRERRFVLEPLAQLTPEWTDPISGKTVAELLKQLRT